MSNEVMLIDGPISVLVKDASCNEILKASERLQKLIMQVAISKNPPMVKHPEPKEG
ncbi:hypothetical protein UFOVP2_4 [uncultured Caudovirales phage]|uniref:Uncharacterized protein n=1 Tax=uncultured Caudovirales phage TaxID=2100421 RepID=A0A6J5KI03_9CAUD|nr:hypothetical protein UFOVP2_4 [uncultured Caudovirales phage]